MRKRASSQSIQRIVFTRRMLPHAATGFRPNQRMEQQLEHPAAYEAYPWLKDMRTSLEVNA